MIERIIVMECAERAGFGGVSRSQLYTRLALFAESIAAHVTRQNSLECEQIGNRFKQTNTEFADGQMDGAYQCAEHLAQRK